MAQSTNTDFDKLLQFPTESMTVEYKGWLDLSDNSHKAILAKAAIALANEGGGVIVLGTREDNAQGGKLGSYPRPTSISRYSVDDINAAIARFAEPKFHCEVSFVEHPKTQVEHTIVIVPGGITVPVMSCRGSDGEIQARRCYVRKPGPKIEEPYTAEEWRRVIERCVQARREDMLDAIRAIVQGHTDMTQILPDAQDKLQKFVTSSRVRWKSLIDELPADNLARMPNGYYETAFSILGINQLTLTELRRHLENASRTTLTGWPPFLYLNRDPFKPQPVESAIETWLGNPDDEQRFFRGPDACDYWRAHPEGHFFLLRGYTEDSTDKVKSAGTVMDVTLPIWRMGEILLFASRLAKSLGDDPEIMIVSEFTGLHKRRLVRLDGYSFDLGHRCIDDTVHIEAQATAQVIEDNLAEVLLPFLRPLYERFSFYELDPRLVTRELERLRKRRS